MTGYPTVRTAWEEFLAWLIGGSLTTLAISPVVWFLFTLTGHTITYLVSLGIAALIVFVGIVIIRIADDGTIDI